MFDKDQIVLISNLVEKNAKSELDTWKVPEDLNELYEEIETALNERDKSCGALLAEYREFMQKEADMSDPHDAYLAGIAANGKDRDKEFLTYVGKVMNSPENSEMLKNRDRLFYNFCDILKDDERRLLLTDYNEIFRQYNGIISRNIHLFFYLGFCHVGEDVKYHAGNQSA